MLNKSVSMGIFFILIISGFLVMFQFGSQNVSGTTVSGTLYDGNGGPWTVAGNPYIVIDDITIPTGQTLTIESGVIVKFDGWYRISVDGNLSCVGTEANRINITSNKVSPSMLDWAYFEVFPTGHLEVRYTNISYSTIGFWIKSSNNSITNNIFSDNGHDIYSEGSSYNNITGNIFDDGGIDIMGDQLEHFNTHTIPDGNIVNNKPIYYYKNSKDIHIDGIPIGQIIVTNCTNVSIQNTHVTDTVAGVMMSYCTDVLIANNTFTLNHDWAIYSWSSTRMNITNNLLSDNYWLGIHFDRSSNSSISYNNISNNDNKGILLVESSNNNINGNEITHNIDDGIWLSYCLSNRITENNVSYNGNDGLLVIYSHENRFYHNNIIDNSDQVVDNTHSNFWNDTYPSGGNYWSHFSPTHDDLYNGPITPQTTGSPDGICDDPFLIDGDSADYYPLKIPFNYVEPPPDITPPVIDDIIVFPEPQEVHDHVNISAVVGDDDQIDNVWINITDPLGGTFGNFSMDHDPVLDQYYRNDSYDLLGTYQFTIWTSDPSSNWNFSFGTFVMEDTTSPVIDNVISDPSIQAMYGNVNISTDVTDNFELSEVFINVTGPNNFWINDTMDQMTDTLFYINRSYDDPGIYNYTIFTKDSSNNWDLFEGSFMIQDTTLPGATVDIAGSYWKNTTTFQVLWAASDNIGLWNITLHYRYGDNNATWDPWTEHSYNDSVWGTTASGSFEFIAMADGYYEFYANASDTEGNWEPDPSGEEAIAAIDTNVPTSSITVDGYWHTLMSLLINSQIGDSNPSSGIRDYIRYYRFSPDNSSWGPWEEYLGDGREGHYQFYGIAEDNAGNIESKSIIEAMYAIDDTPPIAVAGEDRIVEPGTVVTLDGSGSSDNFGMITNYTWVITLDSFQIATFYGPDLQFEFSDMGFYIVNLTVRDQHGHPGYDEVSIHSTTDMGPPDITSLPIPSSQEVYGRVNITASVSDNEEVAGVWIRVMDPVDNEIRNVSMDRAGLSDDYWLEDSYSILGTFTYWVWAEDTSYNWNVSQGSFVIKDTTAPVADAGENVTINVNDTVNFDGSQSTDNLGIINYSWNIYRSGNLIANLYGINPGNRFVYRGTYEVTLTVKDSSGNVNSDTVIVSVEVPDSILDPKKDPEESSNLWLLILILIIVTVFILFIVLRKRQRREPQEEISDTQISQQSENGEGDPSDPIEEKELPEEKDILPAEDEETIVE